MIEDRNERSKLLGDSGPRVVDEPNLGGRLRRPGGERAVTSTEIKRLAEAIGTQIMLHVDNPDLTEIEELLRSINEKLDTLIELAQES